MSSPTVNEIHEHGDFRREVTPVTRAVNGHTSPGATQQFENLSIRVENPASPQQQTSRAGQRGGRLRCDSFWFILIYLRSRTERLLHHWATSIDSEVKQYNHPEFYDFTVEKEGIRIFLIRFQTLILTIIIVINVYVLVSLEAVKLLRWVGEPKRDSPSMTDTKLTSCRTVSMVDTEF